MTERDEYGLEDICVCLDDIKLQLKRLVELQKMQLRGCLSPSEIAEVSQI